MIIFRVYLFVTKILLIRHALTDAVGKTLSGRMHGIHLNDEGKKQAFLLAESLSATPLSAIFSSPLERATETAYEILRFHSLEIKLEERLTEIDYGEWTNARIDAVRHDPLFRLYNDHRSLARIPGGELITEAQTRIVTCLEKIRSVFPEETVAVVSHADVIKTAIAYYAGIHLDMITRIEIGPASVSIIDLFHDFARIHSLNRQAGNNIHE